MARKVTSCQKRYAYWVKIIRETLTKLDSATFKEKPLYFYMVFPGGLDGSITCASACPVRGPGTCPRDLSLKVILHETIFKAAWRVDNFLGHILLRRMFCFTNSVDNDTTLITARPD